MILVHLQRLRSQSRKCLLGRRPADEKLKHSGHSDHRVGTLIFENDLRQSHISGVRDA